MKSIFKSVLNGTLKSTEVVNDVAPRKLTQAEINRKKVMQIHKDFYDGESALIAELDEREPMELIPQATFDLGKQLKKLGFDHAKEAVAYSIIKGKNSSAHRTNIVKQSRQSALSKLKLKYPTLKFIDEVTLKRLNKKYGLVNGPVNYFIGEVPAKNLAEMVKVEINRDDVAHLIIDRTYESSLCVLNFTTNSMKGYDCGLIISAPYKDFHDDFKKYVKADGSIVPFVDKDPIVMQPMICDDFLFFGIITAWGEEAYDPEVMNEQLN